MLLGQKLFHFLMVILDDGILKILILFLLEVPPVAPTHGFRSFSTHPNVIIALRRQNTCIKLKDIEAIEVESHINISLILIQICFQLGVHHTVLTHLLS